MVPLGLHWAALVLGLLGFSSARADPVITEFMASNKTTLLDADGAYSDWIEIHNPDATPAILTGWSLTDNAKKKTKWTFPAVTLPAGGYLVVFASSKDRTDPAHELHTNFALGAEGEYLALIRPDGVTATTEFAPVFPPQAADVSFGITQPAVAGEAALTGYFGTATPSRRNGGAGSLVLVDRVAFSRAAGLFTGTAEIVLTGATGGQTIRYVIAAPSGSGATIADPTADSAEYHAPIVLGGSAIIRTAVFTTDGTRHGPIATAHYLKVEDSGVARVDHFTSQLPLLVFDDHGLGALEKDGIDHPAWFYRFLPAAGGITSFATAPETAGPITMSVRGYSSAGFPKKSYKFTFVDERGADSPTPLFASASFADWNIVGPWNFDRAYIRNAFVYALSNRMGRWAPRTQLAEVFFNANGGPLDTNDYAGIYVVTDKIEAAPARIPLAEIAASDLGAAEITGGYLLKIDDLDAEKYAWTTNRHFPGLNDSVLLVESPKAAKLPTAQRDYIRNYVQQLEDALYTDQANGWMARSYLNYLDLPSWVDFHLLNVFVKNTDGLWHSAYFSKERGGKIVAGPVWDYDRSLGSTDGRDAEWNTWSPTFIPEKGSAVDYWEFGWWGALARDPEFRQAWVDRWQTLRRGQFSDEKLSGLVDQLAGEIGPAAAARDSQRWPENLSSFGSYAAEVAHLEDWVTHRAHWIDRQFVAAPTLTSNADGTITLTPAAGAELVYTVDGNDPRSFGGGLAASAQSSATPLNFVDTTDVRARSHSLAATPFPGSPWSAAVANPHAAAPQPPAPARLVNLASRGNVQSGENILIAGIVVDGAAEKSFLARAVGPALAGQGVNNALADPVLRIVRHDGVEFARNAGWNTGPDAAALPGWAAAVGAFPLAPDSHDAAVVARLPAGVYSLLISSAANRSGIGLVELYELNRIGRAINLSARGVVRPGEGLLIGGFVISGSASKRVLIRAVGPTLASMGVDHALANPSLTLRAGPLTLVTNDDWGTGDRATLVAAATDSGAFALPEGSKDAALVTTLGAGVYSVLVEGRTGDEGVALVEIYDLP